MISCKLFLWVLFPFYNIYLAKTQDSYESEIHMITLLTLFKHIELYKSQIQELLFFSIKMTTCGLIFPSLNFFLFSILHLLLFLNVKYQRIKTKAINLLKKATQKLTFEKTALYCGNSHDTLVFD